MKKYRIKVPDYRIIKIRFAVINGINTFLLYLTMLLSAGLLYLIYSYYAGPDERFFLLVPLIHFGYHFFRIILIYRKEFKKLSDHKTETIGNYKTPEVADLFNNLIQENFKENEEKPEIYVEGLNNVVLVMNALHINFIRRMNFILISESLFGKLTKGELKAVIGHEIAHFKRYIPVGMRVYFIYYLFSVLFSYVAAASISQAPFDFKMYIFAYIMTKVIPAVWSFFANRFQHDVEYLSDLYSAKRYGKLNMINSLIKLYHANLQNLIITFEICSFVKKSRNLDISDIGDIYESFKRNLTSDYINNENLSNEINRRLGKMEFDGRKPLSRFSLFKRNFALKIIIKRVKADMNYKHIKWESIDLNRNGVIEFSEYESLISCIKNNPELQLFQLPGDNIRKMKYQSHPTLRERILFLDKNIK